MTERGLPTIDGAAACPFVAFEDDRDARASGPDHRHRCFAEVRPAPRALAHQEAYCLSGSFPVCPAFQDWARREAAQAVTAGEPVAPGPLPVATEAYRPTAPGDRNPPRDWTAPPPWLDPDRIGAAPAQPSVIAPALPPAAPRRAEPGPPAGAPSATPPPPAGTGLAGGIAARLMGDADPAGTAAGDVPAGSSRRPVPPLDAWPEDESDEAEGDEAWEDDDDEAPRRPPRRVATTPSARAITPGRPRREREEAPSWEEPRRYEAYPSLRSRRLPSLPPILLAVVAVVVAAVVLFNLPGFLGLGSPAASPTPTAATLPTNGGALPSDLAVPTATPLPTQLTYTVVAGDTMSRIANKFGIGLQALIDANKANIPNPDALQIGDKVIIPSATPTSIPNAASTAP